MAQAENLQITRQIIGQLGDWVSTFSRTLPAPVRVPQPGGFHWEFQERSPRVLQLAKAVRMASGIRAALLLADEAMVTESASILRMVSDYAVEITAVGEGMMRGQLTTAQQKFIDQFFAPFPATPEENDRQEKEFYVSREDLIKSEVRLANDAKLDGERMRSVRRYLNKGYDAYVHGAYPTAMQLYNGRDRVFDVTGVPDDVENLRAAKVAVAGKLHEVVSAMEFMAQLWGLGELHGTIRRARHQLEASQEDGHD